MNRKKILLFIVWAFVIAGFIGYMSPMFLSMGPSKLAEAKLPRIYIGDLKSGETRLEKHPMYGDHYSDHIWSILFYKHVNGKIYAWDVPSKNNEVGMPDFHWWRTSGYTCPDFYPAQESDGKYVLKCHGQDNNNQWWHRDWAWYINGENVYGMFSDMLKTNGHVNNENFIVGKSER
ncbi:hypothetical protein [Oceanicoccus sp. KOV_DT_Chl]|uniref:hypothetical protein n=1 Tax=Oceanicoccus sp. KOV_DT_Chl TaxID=1904639 RepID=UPI000C7AF5A2|nr:hypothetical protein [Oceanicoccus sp. KOV_DT_Chl]